MFPLFLPVVYEKIRLELRLWTRREEEPGCVQGFITSGTIKSLIHKRTAAVTHEEPVSAYVEGIALLETSIRSLFALVPTPKVHVPTYAISAP